MRSSRSHPSLLSVLGVALALLFTSCHSTTPEPAKQRAARPVATSADLLGRVLAARAGRLTPTQRADIVHTLANAERDHGLDPLLVLGVIEQESRFDPRAVGPHGSLGLMQVRPFVGEEVARRRKLSWRGPDTLFEPRDNVRIGVSYLKQMIDRYGDVDLALAAYNMGPNRLRAMLDRGGYPRGTYSRKVYAHRSAFLARFASFAAVR